MRTHHLGMADISSGIVPVGRQWSLENETTLSLENETMLSSEPELRVAAFHDPPHFFMHRLRDGSYRFDGYLYDVWKVMAETLNLRYRIVPLLNGSYGLRDEHGIWNGIVGELAYKRADVALSWIFMRKNRTEVIDFLDYVPIDETYDTFYIYASSEDTPSPADSLFSPLLRPLHMNVWFALLGTLMVISLVLKGTVRFSRAEDRRSASEATWTSCLFSAFMSLVGQGWPSVPSSLSGRTVTIFTWLVHICIHTSYTANLISYLTVMTVNRPISSLKEFSEQPDWILAMRPGHIHLADWGVSQNKYERELYQRVMNGDQFIPLHTTKESALGFIRPKVLAYVDMNRLFYYLGSEACSLYPLYDEPAKPIRNYIPVAKGKNRLRRAMNGALQKMNEAGVIQILKNRWLKHKIACVYRNKIEPVSISNSMALLMVLPLGLVASSIIIVFEWLWLKKASRWKYWHKPGRKDDV